MTQNFDEAKERPACNCRYGNPCQFHKNTCTICIDGCKGHPERCRICNKPEVAILYDVCYEHYCAAYRSPEEQRK